MLLKKCLHLYGVYIITVKTKIIKSKKYRTYSIMYMDEFEKNHFNCIIYFLDIDPPKEHFRKYLFFFRKNNCIFNSIIISKFSFYTPLNLILFNY